MPCRGLYCHEGHLKLQVCEDVLAITLPPHFIICENFSLIVGEVSLT